MDTYVFTSFTTVPVVQCVAIGGAIHTVDLCIYDSNGRKPMVEKYLEVKFPFLPLILRRLLNGLVEVLCVSIKRGESQNHLSNSTFHLTWNP